jgi:protein ImuB
VRAASPPLRPLLLLPAPHPLPDEEPLALLAGPERIETGWWAQDGDGFANTAGDEPARPPGMRRDYFVARNGRGQLLWVYRDLAPPRHWFLHGYFA